MVLAFAHRIRPRSIHTVHRLQSGAVKRRHFEHYAPICPVCLGREGSPESPVQVADDAHEVDGDVIDGRLICSDTDCQVEFPILEGIPFLVPDPASFLAAQGEALLRRRDLPESLASLLGDALGPGSAYDTTRQHLSSYAWDHYADLDPEETAWTDVGSIQRLLEAGLALAGEPTATSTVDLGCGPGRSAFRLAARDPEALVLGVDLHVPMLRLGSEVLRAGRVRYPKRRVGLVYNERVFEAALPGSERVDLWACDATRLPLRPGSIGLATALNLLDCTADPLGFLGELERVLRPSAKAVIATPYDWSTGATGFGSWIGGHSQRDTLRRGDSATILKSLLNGDHASARAGLSMVAEEEAPWRVRLHDRSLMTYQAHVVAVERS